MANPIQQGLKPEFPLHQYPDDEAAMANPIQQGLKQQPRLAGIPRRVAPQWLIQYNKD